MKRSPPASATWTWPVVALLLLASALAGYPQAQKKSAPSTQEKPDALLAAAMEKMRTGVWSVNGTVTVKKTIKLRGLLSGEDFDLTMEPGVKPNTPMREIVIKDKAWICSDGETWHAGSADDRLIYNWTHVPIMLGRQLPPFEKVGVEQRNGQTCMHVRLKVPEDPGTPNHYGIVEFPHDALVKLGFLKKIVSGAHVWEDLEKMGALGRTEGEPVSFYVQVIPIGEKPAARAVAVGAKFNRHADGTVSYTWAANEKAAKSPSPAAMASDASDGDLVNRGIEKAKKGDLDRAIADFDRAAELNPKDDAPYYNRAQAKRLKKDTAGAIADYTRAIDLGSTNPAAYNNRGNARAENKDLDGAIADYTRAIELKPDYARAYYNRAVVKEAKGDKTGAEADFKMAAKLDPELASDNSPADPKNNGSSEATTVSLLDGMLKLHIPSDFSRDPDDPKEPKTVASFSGPDGAWGTVLRGTHGLTPDQLEGYLKKRVAEYNKGFKWLPKDSHLQWLKKEIVTIDGSKWADWSFVPIMKGR